MYTAADLYGAPPVVEASQTGVPEHAAAGAPEPNRQVAARTPGLGNPLMVLLALLAVAFLLVSIDVRFTAAVET